jgi:transposase
MYSEKLKSISIKLYNQFKSYRKVAHILDISKSIIHYWINYKYSPVKKTIQFTKIYKYIK